MVFCKSPRLFLAVSVHRRLQDWFLCLSKTQSHAGGLQACSSTATPVRDPFDQLVSCWCAGRWPFLYQTATRWSSSLIRQGTLMIEPEIPEQEDCCWASCDEHPPLTCNRDHRRTLHCMRVKQESCGCLLTRTSCLCAQVKTKLKLSGISDIYFSAVRVACMQSWVLIPAAAIASQSQHLGLQQQQEPLTPKQSLLPRPQVDRGQAIITFPAQHRPWHAPTCIACAPVHTAERRKVLPVSAQLCCVLSFLLQTGVKVTNVSDLQDIDELCVVEVSKPGIKQWHAMACHAVVEKTQ